MPTSLLPQGEIFAAAMSLATGSVSPQILEDDFDVDADVLNEAMSSEYRGIGFHGMIRAAAAEAGIPVGHHIADAEYYRLAQQIQERFDYRSAGGQISASQGWSTMNLASINENVLNRAIHSRFAKHTSIIPAVAQEAPSRDFRPHKTYRMYGHGFFKKVGATGEIEHLQFSDTGFSNAVDTTAGMVTIPRTAIINDEIGIFDQMAVSIADVGFDTRERDFCYLLLDPSLWRTSATTAPDGNGQLPANALASGGSSAFGIEALEALDDVLSNQRDRADKPIRTGGEKVLLTQAGAMARRAKDINQSSVLMDLASGTKAGQKTEKANPFYGELDKRVSTQWLNHEEMGSRQSATAFFMFADPLVQPFLQVLYLNDRRTPHVESERGAFNVLGQQMRSYWDYGMAQIDDVGGGYSPGA
ncbi:hypothetical protein [Fuerstiella marisgermanici]|uniref:Mu-like prophage major head subunit gpT n=1 Tax=Fuerstiella marisgermanici TaxID=1891926 RepID=A0A1P8WDP9_9PLAN|nr:hypothetical protein [Fuerstiella marisgermanici]APZ92169.1 hypothetical protein Fuma_01777 [Fuerstiella marisgermanici]